MKKRKREKVELEVDNSAQSLADEWYRQMGGEGGDENGKKKEGSKGKADDGGDDDDDEGFKVPRPSRLGIGAKFIPHSKAIDVCKEPCFCWLCQRTRCVFVWAVRCGRCSMPSTGTMLQV